MTKRHVLEAGPAHFSSVASASSSRVDQASTPPPQPNRTSSSSDETIHTPDTQESELYRMADAASVITQGALAQIGEGHMPEEPILQCVQIKPMASQNGNERYRVVMNDTRNFIQGMLGQRE